MMFQNGATKRFAEFHIRHYDTDQWLKNKPVIVLWSQQSQHAKMMTILESE